MDEIDIDMEDIPVRYRKLFEQVQEQLDKVQDELDHLENTGEADEYPVKHQKAVNKLDEIQEQMDDLRDAVKQFQSEEGETDEEGS